MQKPDKTIYKKKKTITESDHFKDSKKMRFTGCAEQKLDLGTYRLSVVQCERQSLLIKYCLHYWIVSNYIFHIIHPKTTSRVNRWKVVKLDCFSAFH